MARFASWRAYEDFEARVLSERRFVHTPAMREFLSVVRETAEGRAAILKKGSPLWRARLGSGLVERYDEEQDASWEEPAPLASREMIPMADKASAGRAQPRGIAYLYLSTRRETAIAEVRPWVGAEVSVGLFEAKRDLKLVDCTVGIKEHGLFFTAPPEKEWDKIVWSRIDKAFARPVGPDEGELDYVPTQVLAEWFREAGYEGIAYQSALGKGSNCVLFDIDSARLKACFLWYVRGVEFEATEVANPYFINYPEETETS